jgi:hypothetical protein
LQDFLRPSREQKPRWAALTSICATPTRICTPPGPGRDIPKEQAQKLLTTGKTDLLEGFLSKPGRPFSAYLKLEDGKVGFEFPEKTTRVAESKEAQSN